MNQVPNIVNRAATLSLKSTIKRIYLLKPPQTPALWGFREWFIQFNEPATTRCSFSVQRESIAGGWITSIV